MKNKNMKYRTVDSLQNISNLIDEANTVLGNPEAQNLGKNVSEVVAGGVGGALGGGVSVTTLYMSGVTGLSAAGITSGLAATGRLAVPLLSLAGVTCSPMVAGIGVLSMPVVTGYAICSKLVSLSNNKQLEQEKKRLYKEALKSHDAIISELKEEIRLNGEKTKYLDNLVMLLKKEIGNISSDLEGCVYE